MSSKGGDQDKPMEIEEEKVIIKENEKLKDEKSDKDKGDSQNDDLLEDGVIVKPEYVLKRKAEAEVDIVEKKFRTNEGRAIKKRRSKKEVGLGGEYNNLCRATAQGNKCEREKCTFSHDIQEFLSTKPVDIGSCYIFEKTGYCPNGFTCRFGSVHINKIANKLKFKPENERTPFEKEINPLNYPLVMSLRKKTYKFEAVGALADGEIKKIDYKNKVYIAPLTTVGNLPFRRICVDYGADITTGEMAVVYNLLKGSNSEWALLRRHPSEKIFGVQIAGANSSALKEIGEVIRRELTVDFVDLNAGCPIDAMNKIGCGAALLQRREKLQGAVESLISGLQTIPLILKTRTAYDKTPNIHSIVSQIPMWGAKNRILSALCIHGRTRAQRYSKSADWDYVSKCASSMNDTIPVLGNGDIFNYKDFYEFTSKPRISGAMIGRGALIKPWLPTEIKEQRDWDISGTERLEIIKTFVNYGLEHWGSDQKGVDNTRRYLLEWLSFLCRYVPIGLLERPIQKLNQRIPEYVGRNDLETLFSSTKVEKWIEITELFLGKVAEDFSFRPKHIAKSSIQE